ncbi:hypothetical protein NDU88_002602 [Pleurodeles waltl]|uniref:Uncharacterized protein n=1 Tax=Pleurodeles waltl TaxID=8319 RepID=A0AAV7RD76_PLEWA|nr:hypothetical protein NDU88_002602 [Pleurodeles waltl]
MAISLFTLNVRNIKSQVMRVGTLSFLATQDRDICFLQKCEIPYAQLYSQLAWQWTHRPSLSSGGNDCKSSGVAILIKGRHFTTNRVTEQVNGRVLVVYGSWSGMYVTSKLLMEMICERSLQDVIGRMGLNARNVSWSRSDISVCSRIDFLFTSPTVKSGQSSMVAIHYLDHRPVSFEGELTGKFPAGPGSWKLNCLLLENKELVANLRVAYVEWRDMRDLFHSTSEWWEWVKDRFRSFFQDASRAAAREKRRARNATPSSSRNFTLPTRNLQSGKEHIMKVVTDFHGELYSPKSSERSQVDSSLKGI